MFFRWYRAKLAAAFARPYVNIVFGARQTGKSTLIRSLLPPDATIFDLSDPALQSDWLARPASVVAALRALDNQTVFIDEAQKVPAVFDAVQLLVDEKPRGGRRFILCGSSARKLRRLGTNLLPGRALVHRMFPLTLVERPALATDIAATPIVALPIATTDGQGDRFPAVDLETRLVWGDLPGIAAGEQDDRSDLLRSYVVVHLEEEIRREQLIRDWGSFVRFLRLAASESGQTVNHAAISQESGISKPTVKSHYELLEDMFVGFHVQAWSKSPRKNLLSTPRFFFFDLGVRHAAAGLRPSLDVVRANPGPFFEQWVGIELWKRLSYLDEGSLHYLRTRDGAEIDYIVSIGGRHWPIEVKWTEHPTLSDARHLETFLDENPRSASRGTIVCRCPRPMQLNERILAVPWWAI